MIQQIFRALEPFGQLFADRLFDHARPGETNQRVGFGDLYVAQHRVTGGDAAGRRVGQHANIGQARFFDHLQRHGGARHLHQGQDPLLHTGTARCGKDHQRYRNYKLEVV